MKKKKNYLEEGLPKKGAWTNYRFKMGLGEKDAPQDTPMHTMCLTGSGFMMGALLPSKLFNIKKVQVCKD